MKFTVSSADFQHGLAKISGVVPSKSTLPILENILFDLKKNSLRAVATDLEVSVSIIIDVKGTEDGTVTIPARRLLDTLRSLPDVQLVVSVDQASHKVKLITETGEYTIMGESSDEFPAVPQFKADHQNQIDISLLKKIIGATAFAVSTDELRPAMTGMLLQLSEKALRAVATIGGSTWSTSVFPSSEQKAYLLPVKASVRKAEGLVEGKLVDLTLKIRRAG